MSRLDLCICLVAYLVFLCASPVPGVPADDVRSSSISGVVRDAETGEAIPRANVTLLGTLVGDAGDEQGWFRIANVPPGPYVLSVAVIGYTRETRDIELKEGEHLNLEIHLEPTPIEISPVVVTASRRPQDASEAPVSVSVLTARDIEKWDVVSPDQVLRHAPGVVVTETQASIRGSSGFHRGAGSRLLLLVDGVPALAGDTGDIKWDLIPPDQIERIEVVKSASSALYGSSALGGVVNIVTLPVSDIPETRFRLSAGYFDDPYYPQWKWTSDWLTSAGIDVSHSRSVGEVGLFAAFGKKTSDGYRRNSDFDRSSAMAKVTYSDDGKRLLIAFITWALEEYGHSTEWKSQGEALDITESAWHDRVTSEKVAGYIKAKNLLGLQNLLSGTINWYFTEWDNDFHDVQDNADALKLGGSLQLDMVLGSRHEVTCGVEGWHTGVNSTMFGDRQIGEIGLFGEVHADVLHGIALTLGARYDGHYLGEGRAWQDLVSPRAAVVFRGGRIGIFNISAGRGFRAPTVAEMFTSTSVGGFTVKPNPDLASERGNTYEIAWTGDPIRGLRTCLSLFRSNFSELIEPAVDPADDMIHFTNVHDATVYGLEAWLRSAPIMDRASLAASYMFLSTEDDATGEPLAYRSKHNLKSSVDLIGRDYSVGLDFIYRSRVERVKVYENDERVAIYVTDLRGEARLGRLRLSAKVANLFQYNYTEIERNLAPRNGSLLYFRYSLWYKICHHSSGLGPMRAHQPQGPPASPGYPC
jgi:iron complex outermembrane receptor protein